MWKLGDEEKRQKVKKRKMKKWGNEVMKAKGKKEEKRKGKREDEEIMSNVRSQMSNVKCEDEKRILIQFVSQSPITYLNL